MVGLMLSAGCVPRPASSISDPDPIISIPAIKQASHDGPDAVRALVERLDSDDPAIRFYAIRSLQKLTGQTLGYRYYDDAEERRPAVEQWQRWLHGRYPAPATARAGD